MTAKKTALLLAFLLIVSLLFSSCAKQTAKQEEPLTMYVGLGNTQNGYYLKLHDMILEKTGVDVKLVYNNTQDTTSAVNQRIRSNSLPADIVITSSATEFALQENAFLDLAKYTNIPDLFSITELRSVSRNGCVYQLPFTSRLIGVEYNKTLLNEMGWELPHNFQEMLELQEKVVAAGYPIAVTGGAATGHGFNYLFHLMGTNYLCTPNGMEWYQSFMAGQTDVALFREKSDYFRRYAEAGLFGIINHKNWAAAARFQQTRALFYYNILNDAGHYDGFRYTPDGLLYGAEYGSDGLPVAVEAVDGEAVFVDGSYVYYQVENEKHQGLTRYHIPGAVVLHDDYATMPWLSENGSSNCFTAYHNMYLALDKKLGETENAGKLTQAVKVMEYMAGKEAADFFCASYPDGYVATGSYTIDSTRLYADYAEDIQSGYLIPWYYNDFDNDTIVAVGQLVNDYLLKKPGVKFEHIMDQLQLQRDARLSDQPEVLCSITETLDYENSAKVQAIGGAMSLEAKLAEAGVDAKPTVALLPYTKDISVLPAAQRLPLVQERLYRGDFQASLIRYPVHADQYKPVAVSLSGAEIKKIVQEGYNPKENYNIDMVFPVVCVCRGQTKLQDDADYIVSVIPSLLGNSRYQSLTEEGKVLCNADGQAISGALTDGLQLYMEADPTLNNGNIHWD